MSGGGGDSSRVPIPNNVRKSIQEIKKTHPKYTDDFIYTILEDSSMNKNESVKRLNMIHDVTEIAGKHSFDDVYTMLKECNMDPNESAQRLLYIDTFHEVKKKQDRRKNISVDTFEDFRRTRGNQWRGANGGRGTFYSSNALDDVGGGRSLSSGRENGASNRLERVSRPALPVHSEKKNNVVHVAKSDAIVNSIPAMPNGSYISKLAPTRSTDIGGGRSSSSARENGATNPPENVSRQALPVHSENVNNAVHVAKSDGNVNSKPAMSNGSYLSKLAPKGSADVTASTSDPVVSSQITKHICPVGTIKCEIVRCSVPSESNGRNPIGMKFSANEVASGIIPEAPDASNTRGIEPNVVEKDQIPKSLQLPVLSIQNGSHVVHPSLDNQPSQLVNEPLKVTSSEHMTVSGADSHVVPEEESELKISAPKLNVMLEKLAISSHQPVIFPDHLQVPDNFRSLFTFGSLDAASDDSSPLSVTESSQQNGEAVTEPSSSNQDVSPTAQEGEFQDHSPQLSEQLLPSEDKLSSDPPVEHENTKLESTPPTAGFQNPVQLSEQVLPSEDKLSSDPPVEHENSKLESTPSTAGFQNPVLQPSFGYMPHVMGPHFVQLDVPELQGGNSVAASVLGPTPTTQPVMAGQASMALSPPVFPYFRPPYPSYIPYNPYFPHMYLPQNAHLLNHGVFPLQPPTGNVHLQAVAGGKFPASSQYKQASNEDLTASQTKENNTHSAVQQVDDPQVWAPTAGRDAPILVPNYFYNFPQGQHMAFSPLHAGLYHPSQTMTAQSTVQPLVYQSPSTNGNAELVAQPPGSYQQSQHAPQSTNSNSALPNRETS